MFTIKQIIKNPDDRSRNTIRLWEGKDVHSYSNEETGEVNVGFAMSDGVTCSIDSGIVYVMNGNGKTVETFRLRNSEMLG